jgi:glutamate synthase (NADPH/NADH) small chain
MYGIPEFRLPKAIVQAEVENLKKQGVTIMTDMVIGRVLSVDELLGEQGFEAVFVGTGAGLPKFMGIPGENAKGVYSANEFLTRMNLMKSYKADSDTPIEHPHKVAVVGGGNVAMDACRSALRLGAEKVYCVYRRSMAELPARREEVEHARRGRRHLLSASIIRLRSWKIRKARRRPIRTSALSRASRSSR